MSETDAQLIHKVEAKQKELVGLYGQIHEALRRIDRKKYNATALVNLDRALDEPDRIPPDKAIAVLKALIGSTNEDKLPMEAFYNEPFDSTTSVGSFVRRKF